MGSIRWMVAELRAPEMTLIGKDDHRMTPAIDVYTFGIIVYKVNSYAVISFRSMWELMSLRYFHARCRTTEARSKALRRFPRERVLLANLYDRHPASFNHAVYCQGHIALNLAGMLKADTMIRQVAPLGAWINAYSSAVATRVRRDMLRCHRLRGACPISCVHWWRVEWVGMDRIMHIKNEFMLMSARVRRGWLSLTP